VLVDCVVAAPQVAHRQTYGTDYNAAYSGEIRVPVDKIPALALDERKLIASASSLSGNESHPHKPLKHHSQRQFRQRANLPT